MKRSSRHPLERLESRLLLSTYTVTNVNDSGPGSLRDAIQNSTADTIVFGIAGTGVKTILLTDRLEITRNLTIDGPGAALLNVSGNNRTRVFQVDAGVTAEIDSLTIMDGKAPDGAAGNGGGILNFGTLALTNDTIYLNQAGNGLRGGGSGASGGGIYSATSLVLSDDMIIGNSAGNGGVTTAVNDGGDGGSGGGVYCGGNLTVSGGFIAGNLAGAGTSAGSDAALGGTGGAGGGVYARGSVTLIHAWVEANVAGSGGNGANGGAGGAGGSGGGIFAEGSVGGVGGMIDDNFAGSGAGGGAGSVSGGKGGAGGSGGGIWAGGSVTLVNAPVARNIAGNGGAGGLPAQPPNLSGSSGDGGDGGSGGGIDAVASLTLINDTISGNAAGAAGAPSGASNSNPGSAGIGGGIYFTDKHRLLIGNTIVASNLATGVGADVVPFGVSSAGHNLIGVADGSAGWLATDLTGTAAAPLDARLTLPGDYGGPTPSVALLPASPAIDAGDDALAVDPTSTPALPLRGDGRGLPRISGAHVDIGAFEFQSIEVNTLSSGISGGEGRYGEMSLPSAVNLANVDPSPNTISFSPGLSGTLSLTARMIVTGNLTIVGPGAKQLSSSVGLTVEPGVFADVSGLSFTGATAGSGVSGILRLTDCTISGVSGGDSAMEVAPTGRLIATGSTFSDNSATAGAAIYSGGALDLSNCTFAGNQAMTGGAIDIWGGQAKLVNCTVSGNVAPTAGGINVGGGSSFVLDNTIVAGNLPGSGIPGTSDIQGPIDSSSSHNLIGTGGSGGLIDGINGNLVGVRNPGLGALADNGGPTQTMALLAGSRAIDAGDNALAAAAGLTIDQRGDGRVYNRIVDIGAYEFGSALPGDANHDGVVGFPDLLTLARHYGMSNASWEDGDFNGDGAVGFDDLMILAHNYGRGAPAAAAATFDGSAATNSDATDLALVRKRAARRPASPSLVVTSW